MELFQNHSEQFQVFIDDLLGTIERLKPYDRPKEIGELQKLLRDFIYKTEDFYRHDRRLNIGVVGQVKAGKSSFLNTLLFAGQEILPKAATPKTAALTKMEYADQNKIAVEYYTEDEWEVIEDNAQQDSEGEVFASAREIMAMVRQNGISPREYLSRGTEEIEFASYEDLMAGLNQYVGEDGKYTPVVKAVTLYLCKEEFRGLSIVDTPGLNDPIASRTIRTKQFIEVCDVVFFLSQSGSFLDKSDWTLLSSQLPQKGVKRLILVASKYDSGIRDVLRLPEPDDDIFGADPNTAADIASACQLIQRKLTKRARQKTEEFIKDLENRGASQELIAVIEQCKEPVLISALSENMSNKSRQEYSREEENIYQALSRFSGDMTKDLKRLGNFDKIRELFQAVAAEKEKILADKERSFIPNAQTELKNMLSGFREKAGKRLSTLKDNDKEQIVRQKEAVEQQISGIKADLLTIFHELNTRLEAEKAKCVREIRAVSKEYGSVQDRSGTKTVTHSYTVSDSKWWNPFSWGKSHKEYYTDYEHYSYCLAADAVENLQRYAAEAVNQVEKVFTESIRLKELKRRLSEVIANNFDVGSENYDSSLVRLLVEETIAKIEFPVFHINIEDDMRKIAGQFSGEITGSAKSELTIALNSALAKIFETISGKLATEASAFKQAMTTVAEGMQGALLADINQEFETLLAQYNDKEKEIENYQQYIQALEAEIKQIR